MPNPDRSLFPLNTVNQLKQAVELIIFVLPTNLIRRVLGKLATSTIIPRLSRASLKKLLMGQQSIFLLDIQYAAMDAYFHRPNRPSINFWWSRDGTANFGDLLTPYILSEMYDINPVFSKEKEHLFIGSIARLAKTHSVIFGSGIIRKNEYINPNATYLAVRGPITRQRIIESGGQCPTIYGDPAILLKKCFSKKQNNLGVFVIPHFLHFGRKSIIDVDHRIIDIRTPSVDDMEQLIDLICNADCIVTSSLHVFILCTVFETPVTVFGIKGVSIHGDDIKFQDYCEGARIPKIAINYIEKLTNERANSLIATAKVFSVPDKVIFNLDTALRWLINHEAS